MLKAIDEHLKSCDVVLENIVDNVSLPAIESTGSVFHDLMSCIIEQQIHYRSTKKTFAKLLEKASIDRLSLDNWELFEEKALGEVRLSGRKEETIAGLLEFFRKDNSAWTKMEDKEVYSTLGAVKGVGDWTIDMILIYTLKRPDIFSVKDYHIKQAITQLYTLDASKLTKEMRAISEQWAPYRSFGFRYLLAWKDEQKRR